MIKSSHTLRTGEGRPIRPDRILKTLTAILNSRTDTLKRRPLLPILNIKTGEKNGNVINLDTLLLLLHQQCHEVTIWREAADPFQDHNDNHGV